VLELRVDKTSLYAKTQPRHWANGAELSEVTMEEWITLDGRVAHVRFKMTYTGQHRHAVADQEIPAFFAEPDLSTLVLYDGGKPWTGDAVSRSMPGWPNEGRRMAENWACYVDKNDFGVGAYVPVAEKLTCYRYQGGKSSCSYFAPLTRFSVIPGFSFEYDLYLTVGTSKEIRDCFTRLHERKPAK
jgi:hypothetical protein